MLPRTTKRRGTLVVDRRRALAPCVAAGMLVAGLSVGMASAGGAEPPKPGASERSGGSEGKKDKSGTAKPDAAEGGAVTENGKERALEAQSSESVLTGTVKRLDGTAEDLSAYRGKVVVVVNVASRCGLTPQYAGLQKLYESRKDRGLVVLGFPANNFMGQEPGTNSEIAEFCERNYGVTFPMFEKVDVIDPDGEGAGAAHPLFVRLTTEAAAKMTPEERAKFAEQPARVKGVVAGSPSWNFTKYVIDRDGRLAARFDPRTGGDDAAVTGLIDRLLEAKPAEPKAGSGKGG